MDRASEAGSRARGGCWRLPRFVLVGFCAVATMTSPAPAAEREGVAAEEAHAGQPRLVVVGTVTLRVVEPAGASEALLEAGARAGWQVVTASAERVEFRLPPDELSSAAAVLRGLGQVTMARTSVREADEELAALDAERRSLVASRDRLLALQRPALPVEEAMALLHALERRRLDLAVLEAERARLLQAAAAATLVVELEPEATPRPETIPQGRLPFPWLERTHAAALHAPSVSEPRPGRLRSMLDLGLGLELARRVDRPQPGDRAHVAGAALRFRGFPEMTPLGIGLGFDAALSGGAGVAYELGVLAGFGGSFAPWATVGLLGGIGGRSWSGGRVPAAWELPLELVTAFELGRWGRLSLQVRPQWIPGPREPRRRGDVAGIVDELLVGGQLSLAQLAGNRRLEEGAVRLGVTYFETMDVGTWLFGLGLGFGASDR